MNSLPWRLLAMLRRILNRGLDRMNLKLLRIVRDEGMQRLAALPNFHLEASQGTNPEYLQWIEKSWRWLADLTGLGPVSITLTPGRFLLETRGLRFHIHSTEEIGIVHEILWLNMYDYRSARPKVFLDFGMNVGIASLFFAARPDTLQVFAYEPFAPTCQAARENLALNPETATKIKVYNYGLGRKEETLVLPYHFEHKASIGNQSPVIGELQAQHTGEWREETIQITPAHREVAMAKAQFPAAALILKMDVEGAETQILEDFFEQGCLDSLDGIIMEWHYEEPTELAARLQICGFTVRCFPILPKQWIIYAYRTDKPGAIPVA